MPPRYRSSSMAVNRLYRYARSDRRVNAPASKKYVRRQVNAFRNKVWAQQTNASSNAAFNAPFIGKLINPDALFTRSGEKTEILRINARWSASAGTTRGDTLRIIVFQWLQTDTSNSPTIGRILQTASVEPSMRSGYQLNDRENSSTFKILKDFYIRLAQTDTLDGDDIKFGKFSISKKQLQHKYGRGTADGTGKGMVYFMAISNVGTGSSPPSFALTGTSQLVPESTPEA